MASLKSIYERFVSQPSTDDLHPDATLSYISSGTHVSSAETIVKYILRARNDVQVTENILASHEGYSSLMVEVAAECKFKNGPSWLAPGVEENLLDGMVIKIPLVKMVVFNGGKIRSIRVFWDQATVLKQLEIVGARGRGWPITDGTAQIELINKTNVPEDEPKPAKVENASAPQKTAPEPAAPTPLVLSPIVPVNIPQNNKRQSMQTPSRRTYSITGDIDTPVEVAEQKRLPRTGWQNMRQEFLLSQEGDVPLKDRSPVRLPRVGQAPRREFSFSNLAEAYQAQETPIRKPKQATHFEFDEPTEESAPVNPSVGGGKGGALHHDIFEAPDDETPKPAKRQINPRAVHHETIFHDADTTPAGPVKPSIGGGTGGRRPEETIFVEHADDDDSVKPHKSPITRRDQQAHFSFADASPSTPAPKPKHVSLQHFSIEGTPDPNESEYRARALQRKEVNHFRPDTVPHFEFVDNPQGPTASKKENSDGMTKLLKGIGRSWQMGADSPSVAHHQRNGLPKKDLQTHFSFGDKSDDEKENGQSTQSRTKRLHVPVKSEEKEWWET